MNRFFKSVWLFLAVSIISAAIISSLFRALTPWATQYKGDIEHQLSNMLGSPVSIGSMDTGWYWFAPVFNLNQVKLKKQQKTVIQIGHLSIGINLLKSLMHWRIQPGLLLIDGIHLSLYQTDSGWQIEGISQEDQIQTDQPFYQSLVGVLLNQQKTVIKHLSADLHLAEGMTLPLQDLRLTLLNYLGHYQLKGGGELAQPHPTNFEIMGEMRLGSNDLKDLRGYTFFSLKHFFPAQWQTFFPNSRIQCTDGEGNAQFWIDWAAGKVTKLQSTLYFKDVSWTDQKTKKKESIKAIAANLAWRETAKGWQILSDHVNLTLGKYEWPENTIMLSYHRDDQTYFLYTQHLLLHSLRKLNIDWPESIEKHLPKNLQGQLHDTRLQLKDNALNYVLSRCSGVSWDVTGDIPGVNNLAGVLQWDPNEGALSLSKDIDAKTTTLTLPSSSSKSAASPSSHAHLLPLVFQELNTRLNWKYLPQGLRLRLEHFVLSNPNLLLSAEGVVDKFTKDDYGLLRLKANFSTHNTEKWLAYLPKSWLKASVDEWLRTAIKHIDKAGGEVIIDGEMASFPFDKGPGEFVVKSYLSGVDLVPAIGWPKISNLEGYLNVNKRMLETEVTHGNLKTIPIHAAHLRIDDLGLDKETLLVHTQSNTDGKALMGYVMASPLKSKFSALQGLVIKGPLGLDLSLELPLYSFTAPIHTQGEIAFQRDSLLFPTWSEGISLEKVTGSLKFTEEGLLPSILDARFFNEPLQVFMQSRKMPSAGTELRFKGTLPIDTILESMGDGNSSATIAGTIPIEGLVLASATTDTPSTLVVNSSLKGLSVELPPPLGKINNTILPFKLVGKMQGSKIQMDANYGDINIALTKISAVNDWKLRLHSADLQANLNYQVGTNTLSGNFEKLTWQTMPAKSGQSSMNIKPNSLPNLDLHISDMRWDNSAIGDVHIKTTSTKTHWKLHQFSLKTPYYQLTANGDWAQEDVISETALTANLLIHDLAKSLVSWKYEPLIEASRGSVAFQGHWPGSILNFDLKNVSGDISILLKNGRIPNLNASTEEKIGFGKLLSILSLQTLPRRLSFDFSDLSKGGYSFDKFKGNLKLTKGVLSTSDSDMDGPVAHATIKGNIDLYKQFFDLDIGVYPHITASLPIVATIAGGPIAGIATWAASKILDEGIQKVTGYTYKVFGPWKQPTVQPVKIIHKKLGS